MRVNERKEVEYLEECVRYWKARAEQAESAAETLIRALRIEAGFPPPEPPVGATYWRAGELVWLRHHDGWFCTRLNCANCPAQWEGEVAERVGGLTLDMRALDERKENPNAGK